MARQTVIDRRYEVSRPLGKGGMGAVFEAHDRLTRQNVALKLVTAAPRDLQFASRSGGLDLYVALAQEFKVLASLRHPNIISVLNYGFDEEQRPYFTMDLLDNALSPNKAAGKGTPQDKVKLLVQILQALSYLHRRDIIHRDLKPANVRIVNDVVKVLDFGLALEHADYEHSDRIVGTIEYMAPELLRQNPPSVKSDLYAVGVMAYELFTGYYLFDADNIRDLAKQIFTLYPDPDVIGDPAIASVILRLTAKDPDERYENAEDTIQAFCNAVGIPVPGETAAIRESFIQAASFVGRDRELEQLVETLDTAREGHGRSILVGGESGVGKSRLLEELRIRALVNGVLVLRGEGRSQGRSPYQIWQGVVRSLILNSDVDPKEAGVLEALVPDIGELLGKKPRTPDELDPQQALRRMALLIEKLFRGQDQPMLVMLEDAHWAGIESLAVLNHLNKIVGELPMMILVSYRDDERPELADMFPNVPMMKLERLREADIQQLAIAMLGEGGVNDSVVSLLQRETEGNVFFLVEIVRALGEEAGALTDVSNMALPVHVITGGVEKIIQRRLNRIPASVRPVINLAAVQGRYLDLRLLRHLVQDDAAVENYLLAAANAAVLEVQDEVWRFSHEKLRDGVISQMPEDTYRGLNYDVAAAMEDVYVNTRDHFGALAFHWGEANDLEKEARYTALAGEQVLRSGGYDDAINFLERALELRDPNPDNELMKQQANLMRDLGKAYFGKDRLADAKAMYEDSLRLYETVDYQWGIAFAYSDLGYVTYAMRDYEVSYRYFRRSVETAMSVRAQTVALAGIVGVATLMTAAQRWAWSIELASFALDHMSTDYQTGERAKELLADLKDKVPADEYDFAMERGREKKLSEVVSDLDLV